MKAANIETFMYQKKSGWTCKEFPNLDSEETLVLIFASRDYEDNQAPFDQLLEFYPTSKIMGCSTAGEIFDDGIYDQSVVVAVIKIPGIKVKLAHETLGELKTSEKIGEEITKKLWQKDLNHIFLLSDGIKINGTELVMGLLSVADKPVTMSGGLAGDGSLFQKTWTFSREKGFCYDGVAAVGLYGKGAEVAYGSGGGWRTFGAERMITKSKNNVLYELDHQPALAIYKRYLGEHAKELPAAALLFPISIWDPNDEETRVVRTILSINEEENSLTFAGDMGEGKLAQFMTATHDLLLQGAAQSVDFSQEASYQDLLSIAVSCVGRRLVLGERTDEELEIVKSFLTDNVPQVGFYSYGELSPKGTNFCSLHNQTMTVTVLRIKNE